MTRDDPFKTRVRARMAVTEEPYTQARRLLLDYPAPTEDQLRLADALHSRFPPPSTLDFTGARYEYTLTCRMLTPGVQAICTLIARAEWHSQEPCLAIEVDGIASPSTSTPPGGWWTSYGTDLRERGWGHFAGGGTTPDWRLTLTPNGADLAAPVALRLADGDGAVLFDGALPLPPAWLARVRTSPVGLLIITGPVSGTPFPQRFDDKQIEDMLDDGELVCARVLVDLAGNPYDALDPAAAAALLAEGEGVRALPDGATPAQRARAEANRRPMQTATEPCRCSGTDCLHGQVHGLDEDEVGSPCPGRWLHRERYPGDAYEVHVWIDVYACDHCHELGETEVELPDLPWGQRNPTGGDAIPGTVVYDGVAHPALAEPSLDGPYDHDLEDFDEDDDRFSAGCECGADHQHSCVCGGYGP